MEELKPRTAELGTKTNKRTPVLKSQRTSINLLEN